MLRRRLLSTLLTLILAFGLAPSIPSLAAVPIVPFPDVGEQHPDQAYIHFLAHRGIIQGYPDGRFGPDDSLTRSAAVKIATQVAGLLPEPAGAALGFADLAETHWSLPFVRAGVAGGLVRGFEDGSFRPDEVLTRAQLAALALRATGRPTERVPALSLIDASSSDWFGPVALLAVASGMMEAPGGRFRPNAAATRAEAARAFAQALTFTPLAFGRPLEPVATAVSGTVEVSRTRAAAYEPVAYEARLTPGTLIRTGTASAAEVRFPDGSALYLDELSELEWVRSTATDLVDVTVLEHMEVRLAGGRVYASLMPRPDPAGSDAAVEWWRMHHLKKERMKILLPWAELSVHGSIISASAAPGSNKVTVLGGSAVLRSASGAEQQLADNQRSEVPAPDSPPSAAAPLTPLEQQEWSARKDWVVRQVDHFTANSPPEVRQAAASEGKRVSSIVAALPRDTEPPWVTVTSPEQGARSGSAAVTVRGFASDNMRLSAVTVSGTGARILADGSWEATVSLSPGENQITAVAADSHGNRSAAILTLHYNPEFPAVVLQAPRSARSRTVSVTGSVTAPAGIASLTVAGQAVQPSADGSFTAEVTLRRGANALAADVTDRLGRSARQEFLITMSDAQPVITLTDLPATAARPVMAVSGHVETAGAPLARLHVNGVLTPFAADGSFRAAVHLRPGENQVTVEAADAAGQSSLRTWTVSLDTSAPIVRLEQPADGLMTREPALRVTGVVVPVGSGPVQVNGIPVTPDASGRFTTTIRLQEGANQLRIGLSGAPDETGIVYLISRPPALDAVATRADNNVVVSGSAAASFGSLSRVTVNGQPVLLGSDGGFRSEVALRDGQQSVSVEAADAAGNTTSLELQVPVAALPPPAAAAPPPVVIAPPPVVVTPPPAVVAPPPAAEAPAPAVTQVAIAAHQGVYSDPVSLRATLTAGGAPVPGKGVQFSLNGRVLGSATTDPAGVATLSYTVLERAGSHTLTAAFTGDTAFADSASSAALTVSPETATLLYTGIRGDNAGTFARLGATLSQLADGTPGDIARAGPAEFVVRRPDGSVAGRHTASFGPDGKAAVTVTLAYGSYTVETALLSADYFRAVPAAESMFALVNTAGSVSVVAPSTVKAGSTFEVRVRLEGVTNVVTGSMRLLFNPALVQGQEPVSGGILDGIVIRRFTDNARGEVSFISANIGGTPFSGSGTYFTVVFTARSNGAVQFTIIPDPDDVNAPIMTNPGGRQTPSMGTATTTITH